MEFLVFQLVPTEKSLAPSSQPLIQQLCTWVRSSWASCSLGKPVPALSACTVRCSNPFIVLRSSDGYMLPIAVVSAMMSNLQIHSQSDANMLLLHVLLLCSTVLFTQWKILSSPIHLQVECLHYRRSSKILPHARVPDSWGFCMGSFSLAYCAYEHYV